MLTKECVDCYEIFEVSEEDFEWKVRCLPCWKKHKARQDGGYWQPLRPAERDLERELAATRIALQIETEAAKKLRAEVADLQERPPELDPDMLRLLVQLSHPDKHAGSEASTKATAYLNHLRKRSKA